MAADAEQCIYELGEYPSARKVNDALIELGSAAVKQRVIELFESGLTRDQVNVILRDEITPAFDKWLRKNYDCIMRMIHGDAPAHTMN
jgi:hypothetical protein